MAHHHTPQDETLETQPLLQKTQILSFTKQKLKQIGSPYGQVVLSGLICFTCPGMFNAIVGMGGGGSVDKTASDNGLVALYTSFSVFSLVSGGLNNILKPKLMICIGSLFYSIYVSSFLAFNIVQEEDSSSSSSSSSSYQIVKIFHIVAGGLLGIGAGMLWTAQGSIMMSYPTESQKGRFISTFWIIFNMGSVLGGLIPFILNFNSTQTSVNNETYIGFICIMLVGSCLSLLLKDPCQVTREDGSSVSIEPTNVYQESISVLKLFSDYRMLLLLPAFFASNFSYGYKFNAINGHLFNIRSRSFNNVYYWGSQMFGSYVLGRFLDSKSYRQSIKALSGIFLLFVLGIVAWSCAIILQLQYDREGDPWNIDFLQLERAVGPGLLLLLFGFIDAAFQSFVYWLMASLSNETAEISRFSGLYKCIQSAGGAVSWRIDAIGMPWMTQLLINFALAVGSLPFLIVLRRYIRSN